MPQKTKIIGGTMTRFGRHMDRTLKSLAAEAVNNAFKDAGITKEQLGSVWVGNASQRHPIGATEVSRSWSSIGTWWRTVAPVRGRSRCPGGTGPEFRDFYKNRGFQGGWFL